MRTRQNKKSIYLIFGGIVIGFLFTVFYSLARHPQTEVLQPQIEARHPRVDGDPGSQESQKNTSIQNKEEKPLDSHRVYPRADGGGNDDIGSISESQKSASKARISIAGKDLEVVITDNMSVYDAMNVLKEEGKITFEGKEYSTLGFFVTKINSLEAGGGKNLFYYINGEEASVGISTYEIKEGDIIEWKLK